MVKNFRTANGLTKRENGKTAGFAPRDKMRA